MNAVTLDRSILDRHKELVGLAGLIGETVSLRKVGKDWLGCCPFHVEKTPSFHVYGDHYHCFGCGKHGDAIDWLTSKRGMSFQAAVAHLGAAQDQPPAALQSTIIVRPREPTPSTTLAAAKSTWAEGSSDLAMIEVYLASRGIRWPDPNSISIPWSPHSLRFHPRCQRGPRSLPGGPYFAPAMLAELTDPITGEFTGCHRTFLLPDGSGKAPPLVVGDVTLPSKSILGSWGIIRLVEDCDLGHALAIAEGIENAITVAQEAGWTTIWACGSAHGISSFPLIYGIEALSIFADRGEAGQSAARACAERWAEDGREVFVHAPPLAGDWNSLLTTRRAAP